jgi:hypothetical protein
MGGACNRFISRTHECDFLVTHEEELKPTEDKCPPSQDDMEKQKAENPRAAEGKADSYSAQEDMYIISHISSVTFSTNSTATTY